MFDKDHPRYVYSKITDIDNEVQETADGVATDIQQSLSTGEAIGLREYQIGLMAPIPETFSIDNRQVRFEDLSLELQSLLIEYYQLEERIKRISPLDSAIGSDEQRDRDYQAIAMGNYRFALRKRIRRLSGDSIIRQHPSIS